MQIATIGIVPVSVMVAFVLSAIEMFVTPVVLSTAMSFVHMVMIVSTIMGWIAVIKNFVCDAHLLCVLWLIVLRVY